MPHLAAQFIVFLPEHKNLTLAKLTESAGILIGTSGFFMSFDAF